MLIDVYNPTKLFAALYSFTIIYFLLDSDWYSNQQYVIYAHLVFAMVTFEKRKTAQVMFYLYKHIVVPISMVDTVKDHSLRQYRSLIQMAFTLGTSISGDFADIK